jgi:3-isopropylmalate/(R)-2-methylmalate dehydratase small subunit
MMMSRPDSAGEDMESFKTLASTFVVLPINDIDTDQIMPARFLKVTDKKGLGEKLFCDWRYDDSGQPLADFVLNKPRAKEAKILVAGDNFGCGSSREHAPWALVDFGFKAVISTRFADIFRNNALKNGLLPVVVDSQTLQNIMALPPDSRLHIDLARQELQLPDGRKISFPIDSFNKTCLLDGIDTMGYLLRHDAAIATFEQTHSPRVQTLQD